MQWLGRKKSFFSNLYRNTPKEGLTKFQIYVETKKLGLLIFIQATVMDVQVVERKHKRGSQFEYFPSPIQDTAQYKDHSYLAGW